MSRKKRNKNPKNVRIQPTNPEKKEESAVINKPRSFDLIIDQPHQISPTLRMAWCVKDVTISELKQKRVKYPYLLVSISHFAYAEYETQRLLLPLDKAMEFVVFDKPGKHIIRAIIVWNMKENPEIPISEKDRLKCRAELAKCYINKHNDEYRTTFFDDSNCIMDTAMSPVFSFEGLQRITEQEVIVDERFFAKEPPEWLKDWTNLWYEDYPKDQCQFRRRLIWAFTAQPIIYGILGIILTIIRVIPFLVCLLAGKRINSWKALFHPYDMYLDDVAGETFWWQSDNALRKRDRRQYNLPIHGILCMPVIWLILIPFITFLIWHATEVAPVTIWISIMIGTFFGSFAIKAGGQALLSYINKRMKTRIQSARVLAREQKEEAERLQREATEAEAEAELKKFYETRLVPISCGVGGVKSPSLDGIPPEFRSFKLRWLDMKAKVCKPFKRGY